MNEQKKRHGCLTAWLILMLIGNSAAVLIYVLGSAAVSQTYPNAPGWTFPALILLGILNIVFVVALLRWKKMGVLGFRGYVHLFIRRESSGGVECSSGTAWIIGPGDSLWNLADW